MQISKVTIGFYLFLLSIGLGLPLGLDYAFCLFTIFAHFIEFKRVPVSKNLLFLVAPMVVGLVNSYHFSSFSVGKDLYYLSIPVMLIIMGYCLFSVISLEKLFKVFLIAGILFTFKKVYYSFKFIGVEALFDPIAARYVSGFLGNPAPALAIGLLFAQFMYLRKSITTSRLVTFGLVNLFGVYMMASRAYLLFVASFFFWYAIVLLKSQPRRLFLYSSACLFLIIIIINIKNSDNFFTDKLANSLSELSVDDYSTEADINQKYRGFEAFMALKTYSDGSFSFKIFGGLGRLVDLETYVSLNDEGMRYIPILHNGFLYMLVKTGILGLVSYLLFFLTSIRSNYRYLSAKGQIQNMVAFVNLSIIVSLFFSTYIVFGLFNLEMSSYILMIGYLSIYIRNKKSTI
jgi:hypothetical protein